MAKEVAMGMLMLPTMILIIMFPGFTPALALADFSRFAQAEGDMFGAERIGRVIAASDTKVTLEFGSATRVFEHADVFKADRLSDGTRDGLIKGMLIGGLVGWVAGSASSSRAGRTFVSAVSVYGGIGYLLDRANTNRAPLYRK
jgi:hypothetical protein